MLEPKHMMYFIIENKVIYNISYTIYMKTITTKPHVQVKTKHRSRKQKGMLSDKLLLLEER